MAVVKPCAALVRTEAGTPYDCMVANLSRSGAFLRTSADLKFREDLQIELLGQVLQAEVLFVSQDPPGVVVTFDADEAAQAVLLGAQDDVEVLAGQGFQPEDPWDEDTAAGMDKVAIHDESSVPNLPKLGTSDLEVLEFQPELDAEPAPFDPGLMAAAMFDDSSGDVLLDGVDVSETPSEPVSEDLVNLSDPSVDLASDLAVPAPLPLELVVFAETSEEAPETLPPEELEPQPEVELEPEVLPTLERDGFTVRFESAQAYKMQFDTSLRHGGLVVSADPLSIGTQRMLALNVPGADIYTVSARVVFAEPGKLGFMLDSFALHKSHLESLGA